MAPPFPLGTNSNLLSIPTMTLMIVVIFFMQGGFIAISARVIKAYKGVREASIATFSLAFGFLVLIVAGTPNVLIGYLSNIFILSGYYLIYLAICLFTDSPYNRFLSYVFFPISILTLTLSAAFNLKWLPLIIPTLIAGIVFSFSTVIVLYRGANKRYKLSAFLTAAPLLTYALVLLVRLIGGIISPVEIIPGPSFSAVSNIMALFILSFLWTIGFVLMISQRLQSNLNELALNDALTRIRNRRAMQDMLDFEMQRVEHDIRDFSIILIDVDHFKNINDTYGHDVGDKVLLWLASTLQSKMRVQDMVARWGGEEFLILLPDTRLNEALQIAERLRTTIASSKIKTPENSLRISFSAGVANSSTSRNVNRLCKVADQALYIAKKTRNKVTSQEDIPDDLIQYAYETNTNHDQQSQSKKYSLNEAFLPKAR